MGNTISTKTTKKNSHSVKIQDQLNHQLFLAIEENNINLMKSLIKQGADINARNHSFLTPLLLASAINNAEAVKLLLNEGADVNATNYLDVTALHLAAATRSIETLKVLCENENINLDSVDDRGKTALQIAVETNSLESVEILLKNNVEVNITNNLGYTALNECIEGSYHSVRILDQGIWQSTGYNPILTDNKVAIIKLLIEHNAIAAPIESNSKRLFIKNLESYYENAFKSNYAQVDALLETVSKKEGFEGINDLEDNFLENMTNQEIKKDIETIFNKLGWEFDENIFLQINKRVIAEFWEQKNQQFEENEKSLLSDTNDNLAEETLEEKNVENMTLANEKDQTLVLEY